MNTGYCFGSWRLIILYRIINILSGLTNLSQTYLLDRIHMGSNTVYTFYTDEFAVMVYDI